MLSMQNYEMCLNFPHSKTESMKECMSTSFGHCKPMHQIVFQDFEDVNTNMNGNTSQEQLR
jgi:hypothetical protein